ncbi:MAG TPA: histidine kinase dimerization/phospho-acceptor domain-containing protein [Candidatus Nitrosotalea sp.]|nr:histidine kinase dimerization/phospho-acceptor domain-containing protein [Candidatus Nitrosotalea sp.]
MKTLRVRLTLWFALSFLAVTGVFMWLTYRHLDMDLRRKTFQSEVNINPNWILHGSFSEEEVREIMAQLIVASLIYSLPLVLVTLVLGYVIARKSLNPIGSLNQQLRAVDPRTLHRRVQLTEGDEPFQDLVVHLNAMLARLDRSFAEMSDYAAKVAHELRTPVTILRLKVEQSQGKVEPGLAEELEGELHRLAHVIDQSLLIAKAGQGRLRWEPDTFSLADMLSDLIKDFCLLAAEEDRRFEYHHSARCYVDTDPRYCRQILHTLLTNALMHGCDTVRVRTINRRGIVRFTILNRVMHQPQQGSQTLGLGLRVVKALLSQQPDIRFRQHHGSRYHSSLLVFPMSNREMPVSKVDPAGEGFEETLDVESEWKLSEVTV